MNRVYLLKIDDLIRKYRGFKSSRKFIEAIQQDCCRIHITSPTKELIRKRAFRLLTDTELMNIFGRSTFKISYNELKKWREQSITNILLEWKS